jgi:2-dehydropantoate 2-reductase
MNCTFYAERKGAMRFVIEGAGAIGGPLGVKMVRAGLDVVMVGRSPHVDVVRRDGLKLRGLFGEDSVVIPSAKEPEMVNYLPDDVLFMTTKTHDTGPMAKRIKDIVDPDTPVFCFQNGVRNEEIVSEYFNNVYAVTVLFNAVFIESGEVSIPLGGGMAVGRYPEGLDETAEGVVEALCTAGFDAKPHPEIMKTKWVKLLMNCRNSVFAITDEPGQTVATSQSLRIILADLTDEALNVVKAAGIKIENFKGQKPIEDQISDLRAQKNLFADRGISDADPIRPSTWQDVHLKRGKAEVPYFNGEIIRLGKELGIETPINSKLHDVVMGMAAAKEPPGKYSVEELQELLNES